MIDDDPLAEDETEIAEILDAYLVREGFRTVCAADGRTALDLHTALKPDLMLVDVKMPKVDGWGILAEVRRRGGTPVIMVTALDEDIDKLQALRMGADDYVTKPFNPVEIVARTKAVLRRAGALFEATRLRVENVDIDLSSHTAVVVHGEGGAPGPDAHRIPHSRPYGPRAAASLHPWRTS